jgi:hypothetical protein
MKTNFRLAHIKMSLLYITIGKGGVTGKMYQNKFGGVSDFHANVLGH